MATVCKQECAAQLKAQVAHLIHYYRADRHALLCSDALAGFGHLAKDMEKNSDEWYNWCIGEGRSHAQMPGDWARMSEFKQLLLLRALRPDRVATALQHFCESIMGARFVNQEAFSPQAVLAESSR